MTDIPVYLSDEAQTAFKRLLRKDGGWTLMSPAMRRTRSSTSDLSSRFHTPAFRLFLDVDELNFLTRAAPRHQWKNPGLDQRRLPIPIATRQTTLQIGSARALWDRGRTGRAKGSQAIYVEQLVAVGMSDETRTWLDGWRSMEAFDSSRTRFSAGRMGGPPPRLDSAQSSQDSARMLNADVESLTEESTVEITVWFGTNRQPVEHDGRVIDFNQERDDATYTGTCVVSVDKARPAGGFDSSIFKRILGLARSGLEPGDINVQDPDLFWKLVRESLEMRQSGRRTAMVFVHGYCNSFFSAICSAGALGVDVGGWDLTAAFSWPSAGVITGYYRDSDMCAASESAFDGFLRDMIHRSGAEHVHVIAHSMGSRLVGRIMQRIKADPLPDGAILRNVVYAAPDVERTLFRQLVPLGPGAPCRHTLYASRRDNALRVSRTWANQTDRAGLSPPITVCGNLDTIDVTDVDLSGSGHGAFREAPVVIQDLFYLTRHGHAPHERHGLEEAGAEEGIPYWHLRRQRR